MRQTRGRRRRACANTGLPLNTACDPCHQRRAILGTGAWRANIAGLSFNPNLYVAIVPFAGPRSPLPHPVNDGRFDVSLIYKVLGIYNPSETSEAYFLLANPADELWYISNRHLRAAGVIDSNELRLERDTE